MKFFKGGVKPVGLQLPRYRTFDLCQDHNGALQSFYSTKYISSLKIPAYSAYTIASDTSGKRSSRWYVDSSISSKDQAQKSEYKGIEFDRGHLCPSGFAPAAGKRVTFYLTNVAPQYWRFNQLTWKNVEERAKQFFSQKCAVRTQTHFITGVVPGNKSTSNGINIPSHYYTAVCCETAKSTISVGFYGNNSASNHQVKAVTLGELQNVLTRLIGAGTVKIFKSCTENDTSTLYDFRGLFLSTKLVI